MLKQESKRMKAETVSITKALGGKRKYKAHNGPASILAILAECTPGEIANGEKWYTVANRWSGKAAALTGKRLETIAAILARISPQVSWADNKAAALEIASGEPSTACDQCYPDNVIRALEIAECDDDEAIARQVLPFGKYRRPKISAFYRNISAPADEHSVTVDTWAARIWVGDCQNASLRVSAPDSERIADDYRQAALACGKLPQVLQAITWVGAHRMKRDGNQRSLFQVGLADKI
jgi:hypothetical protein